MTYEPYVVMYHTPDDYFNLRGVRVDLVHLPESDRFGMAYTYYEESVSMWVVGSVRLQREEMERLYEALGKALLDTLPTVRH